METINIGDARLAVEVRGAGAPLVLVHGFPLDHTMWRHQVERFAATRQVIVPDLRGFGQSEGHRDILTMQQHADDLAALLRAMNLTGKVTLCGLSMGGYIAWQFWQRHSALLERLIVCDSRAAADSPDAARNRLQTAERVLLEGPQVVADGMAPKLVSATSLQQQPELAQELRQVMMNTPRATIAAALRGMAERPDMTAALGQMNVPTLIVCGEQDAITPAAEMREVAAAIPHAQYVEIAGAGHMSPLESPAEVNGAIEQFLANG